LRWLKTETQADGGKCFLKNRLRGVATTAKQRVPFSPRSGVTTRNRGSGDGLQCPELAPQDVSPDSEEKEKVRMLELCLPKLA